MARSPLQGTLVFSPTYTKDSFPVLPELKAINQLPPNAKLFTCDAVSMYTNIDSTHGIQVIMNWIEEYLEEIPTNFPKELFLRILQIIMTSNIFQLDDTYWLQTCGTSMGTSCTCAYATLYWAYMERKFIIPKWEQKLLLLCRFIDEKFGIWLGTRDEFNSFIIEINSYCQLQWTSEKTSTSVNFLDLTISIGKNRSVTTETFQKPINLHLYISPHSAHPPEVLKSIVYGNLRRYWLQNTNVEDYVSITKQFASHLIARGYNPNKIYDLFIQAANKLDKLIAAKQHNDNSDTIYLPWTWHPRDVSRSKLC